MQRKIILMALFLSVANYASAGWQIVKETRDGILYIDPDSIEKNGEYIKAVSFQDFHVMQSRSDKSFLSKKVECGSRLLTIPLTASVRSCLSSIGSTYSRLI